MNSQMYSVAGLCFCVILPEGKDAGRLLPSFASFVSEKYGRQDSLFDFDASKSLPPSWQDDIEIENMSNGMGNIVLSRTPDKYIVRLRTRHFSSVHIMTMSRDFSSAEAWIDWNDNDISLVLTSLLRIVYSQAVLMCDGVSVHASVVSDGTKAYMFMGRSGTGKSTHSSLWLKYVPETSLVNDDNPVVRVENGICKVYGTPWSGKTPCYRNVEYPLGGAVHLVQATENRFSRKYDIDAFAVLLPGCSVIRTDAGLFSGLCDTLSKIAVSVPVGVLECRPDKEAVEVCRMALSVVSSDLSKTY